MIKKEIYVTQPYLPPVEDFFPYLRDIFSNKILTNNGPYHQKLEEELCSYLGVKHISLFSNGTLALITAIRSMDIVGEIITTPFSFIATAHSILWSGNTPVFVDIDSETLNIDPLKIEAAITSKTKAIMPVHCYGNPCDVDSIKAIADKNNLRVIYDAAHAFGVRDLGGSILRHGDLAVLSFHATKVFNTFEGGAIVCHDAATKKHIDRLKNFGFVDETTVVVPGLNAKMSEINAAFGLLQLKHVDQALKQRARVDENYRIGLADIPGIRCVPNFTGVVANYSYFPILVGSDYSESRDALYLRLKKHGVNTRRYFYPLISDFAIYESLPRSCKNSLAVAREVAGQVLCLPIYPDLEIASVNEVIKLIALR